MKKGKRSLPIFLEIKDVVERLHIGPESVEDMIKHKKLKVAAETRGGIRLFGSADVELIAAQWQAADRRQAARDAKEEMFGSDEED